MNRTAFTMGLALALSAVSASGQPAFTIVARTGQSAPGAAASYDAVHTPVLNSAGQVAFYATLTGPNVTADNATALFSGTPASIGVLVRGNDPVPGGAFGATFKDILYPLEFPNINSDGHVLFGTRWIAAAPGNVRHVPIEPIQVYGPPAFTSGDQVGWSYGDGAHYWSPSNPNVAPSAARPYAPLVLNSSGRVAFMANNPFIAQGYSIQSGPVNNLQTVASQGQPIPTANPGANVNFFMYPTINAAGQVALAGFTDTDSNIYVGTPGNLRPVIQNTVPGLEGLRIQLFSDFDNYEAPALTSNGQIAIDADLWNGDTPIGAVVLAGPAGNVHVVARSRQHAINAPPDLVLDEQIHHPPLCINAKGQVVFLTRDMFGGHKPALYAADADGALVFLAGVGVPFELSPGDTRTIADISFGSTFTGGEDGTPLAFNDAGQLTFGLTFTDNTSAVVFTTVPEPGVVGVVATIGAVGMLRRRRRRLFRGSSHG